MIIPITIRKTAGWPPGSSTILAGDVGASKTNLSLFKKEKQELILLKEATYQTKDFSYITTMIYDFLPGNVELDKVCLGVAGAIDQGKVKLTNIDLEIDSQQIRAKIHVPVVLLINDLEATAYGLDALDKKDIQTLTDGNADNAANVAIIAPGTGLGEAGLYFDGQYYRPFATEGGHCDYAPRTETDIELYRYLHKMFGHVSWERLVSGPGIYNIYRFLHDVKKQEEPEWLAKQLSVGDPAAVITENASNEKAPACAEALDLFFLYLAEECANLVLKLKAKGGLFIGGGIIPKVLPLLKKDVFVKRFCDSGRLSFLLQNVPISIILNEKTALLGAAYYAAYGK